MFNEFDLKSLSLKELDQLISAANEEKGVREDVRFKTLISEAAKLLNTIKKEYPRIGYNIFFSNDDIMNGYANLFDLVQYFNETNFYR